MLSGVIDVSENKDAIYVWEPEKIPESCYKNIPKGCHMFRFFYGPDTPITPLASIIKRAK